jgi:hypothetical protein
MSLDVLVLEQRKRQRFDSEITTETRRRQGDHSSLKGEGASVQISFRRVVATASAAPT